jgi:hypothetical protein
MMLHGSGAYTHATNLNPALPTSAMLGLFRSAKLTICFYTPNSRL